MGKRGRSSKKDQRNPKRKHVVDPEAVDDEIDVFHKQRDVIPLDINGDVGDSDEDNEHPVFDLQDIDDDDDEEDEGDDDDDDIDDAHVSKFAAKIARQQKYLKSKFGGVGDELNDKDDDEHENEETAPWGGIKSRYYGGDNRDFELQSSDDEAHIEEEDEVKEIQKERAKNLSLEDFGVEDGDDESNRELTFEEISAKGKGGKSSLMSKEALDDQATFEKVKKDLNALSKEEQMDVVHSSAPELVGLLSELNATLEELESKVNPILRKAKEGEIFLEGGMRYLEMKQALLLSYCQAITFYLLLKSEGQPVRDHPVLGRIVEIQGLLDKVKKLDGNLPSEWEEILKNKGTEMGQNLVKESAELVSNSGTRNHGPSLVGNVQVTELEDTTNLPKAESVSNHEVKGTKSKHENDQLGMQSREMLKVRAALEDKLKQKGIFSSNIQKPEKTKKHVKLVNGQLETYDDFADDTMDVGGGRGLSNGHASLQNCNKISQLITAIQNKSKVVSGDDDLPKRDDIGERRRKHELRVLAGAAVQSEDDHGGNDISEDDHGGDDILEDDRGISEEENGDTEDSEDDFYKQVKRERDAKLAAKAEMYRKTSALPSLPETVDGKRLISQQIEKNRGLTRQRKKNTKNPRKKYRLQSKKREKQRKGQVRAIRKPAGQYGGETTGINVGISRSVRFKN